MSLTLFQGEESIDCGSEALRRQGVDATSWLLAQEAIDLPRESDPGGGVLGGGGVLFGLVGVTRPCLVGGDSVILDYVRSGHAVG